MIYIELSTPSYQLKSNPQIFQLTLNNRKYWKKFRKSENPGGRKNCGKINGFKKTSIQD